MHYSYYVCSSVKPEAPVVAIVIEKPSQLVGGAGA